MLPWQPLLNPRKWIQYLTRYHWYVLVELLSPARAALIALLLNITHFMFQQMVNLK